MRSGKIPVCFFEQGGYLSIQLIEPADQDFRLLREVHAGSPGVGYHELHPEALLGSLHASPGGSIGHVQFFRRCVEAMAFVDGLEQNIPPGSENDLPVFFQPDFVFDFHGAALPRA